MTESANGHKFTTHPTYTGGGCAICGKEHGDSAAPAAPLCPCQISSSGNIYRQHSPDCPKKAGPSVRPEEGLSGALWLCYHALKSAEFDRFGFCVKCRVQNGHSEDCMVGNGLKSMAEVTRTEGKEEA